MPPPSAPGPVFDRARALFSNATTHDQFRTATIQCARDMLQTYFGAAGRRVVEHGALSTPIQIGDRSVSTEDTFLFETQDGVTHKANAFLLAVNADAGTIGGVMDAVIARSSEELRKRTRENGLGACFSVVMVRENISFFEYHPDLVGGGQ